MQVGQVSWRLTWNDHVPLLYEDFITDEDMGMGRDAVERLVGDGQARVGASLGIKDLDYGSGFDFHVSVSLAVNQDTESVAAAQVIAQELVFEHLERGTLEAGQVYEDLRRRLHPPKRRD